MHAATQLFWYLRRSRDNGICRPVSATTPFRGQKGQVYEGGIRVPGIIEWPDGITQPRVTRVSAVTSDMLPTICDLLDLPVPDRPLDGVSLKPLLDGSMQQRPSPICFWQYDLKQETGPAVTAYLPAELQSGTTPLVKKMGGRLTRNFVNMHHPLINDGDYEGARAILDHQFKLVIHSQANRAPLKELFDLQTDPAEKQNLLDTHPETAQRLEEQLRKWQSSVLQSLTEADY